MQLQGFDEYHGSDLCGFCKIAYQHHEVLQKNLPLQGRVVTHQKNTESEGQCHFHEICVPERAEQGNTCPTCYQPLDFTAYQIKPAEVEKPKKWTLLPVAKDAVKGAALAVAFIFIENLHRSNLNFLAGPALGLLVLFTPTNRAIIRQAGCVTIACAVSSILTKSANATTLETPPTYFLGALSGALACAIGKVVDKHLIK